MPSVPELSVDCINYLEPDPVATGGRDALLERIKEHAKHDYFGPGTIPHFERRSPAMRFASGSSGTCSSAFVQYAGTTIPCSDHSANRAASRYQAPASR